MHKFILFIKEFRIYRKKELQTAISSLSRKQLVLFAVSSAVALISTLIILGRINSMFLVDVPVSGGTLTEGIVGVPTQINPITALSDADKDLSALVYSGLMRKTPDGKFIPDLAESYPEISQDGITYTFKIKSNAKFHNGASVTADDILFTIEKIKDPLIKSPRKNGWGDVLVTKKDDHTVVFTLAQPYISFIDNTTIGILPSGLWKDVDSNKFSLSPLDIKPVGSGPYKIGSLTKNNEGTTSEYKLERFNNFALGKPNIKYLNIVSYANEKDLTKALGEHSIDQAGGINPNNTENFSKSSYNVRVSVLPRIFGIFFNSNNNKIFADSAVVSALNKVIDRNDIINRVLGGYGSSITSPVPEKFIDDSEASKYTSATIDEANSILDKAGWVRGQDGVRAKGGTTTKNVTKKVKGKTVTEAVTVKSSTPATRLSFSITTGDTPELRQTTELLKEQLAQIGIEVDTSKVYETGQLNQIIRARSYEALFFGQIINHESDLYSFWHSSQKTDPGLNIAMYSNKKVDTILESIQKMQNPDDRMKKYKELSQEFSNNIPAILIYSPQYLYVTSAKLNNISLDYITIPSDRFSSVYSWSVNTDKVWKFFTN